MTNLHFHTHYNVVIVTIINKFLKTLQVNPNIIVTDRDEGVNAKIRVSCTTKEKGSDNEACVTFNVVTEEVSLDSKSEIQSDRF